MEKAKLVPRYSTAVLYGTQALSACGISIDTRMEEGKWGFLMVPRLASRIVECITEPPPLHSCFNRRVCNRRCDVHYPGTLYYANVTGQATLFDVSLTSSSLLDSKMKADLVVRYPGNLNHSYVLISLS